VKVEKSRRSPPGHVLSVQATTISLDATCFFSIIAKAFIFYLIYAPVYGCTSFNLVVEEYRTSLNCNML
jgi:hypothetical protein